ncbi:hypothetical protein RRG08_015126 [Elysia crispata]|uniref:Uncharacterized protein n=1 Tax=Elysia crispata TaxID=231223 RepID=A0AAE1ABR4_9GAST|nr:hypothetical protein RRG08_015126 [Elysia crispata]
MVKFHPSPHDASLYEIIVNPHRSRRFFFKVPSRLRSPGPLSSSWCRSLVVLVVQVLCHPPGSGLSSTAWSRSLVHMVEVLGRHGPGLWLSSWSRSLVVLVV